MSERPDERGGGYPPSPAPRTEPYSVDDPLPVPVHAATSAEGGQPAPVGDGGHDGGPAPREEWPERPADSPPPAPWDVHRGEGLPWSSPDPSARAPHWGAGAGVPSTAGHYAPAGTPDDLAGGSTAGQAGAPPFPWPDTVDRPWQSPGPYGAPTEGQRPTGRRRRGRRQVALGVVVLLVLLALLGGTILGALGARWLWPVTSGALPAPSNPASTARAPDSVAGIAAAALESTVFIEVRGGASASSGSGMVLREDGYVVTNNHVIAGAGDSDGAVAVTFADGTQAPAEIVGRTVDYDLAVLKVDHDGLVPLPLADSDAVVVGDPVVAVGAPLGLEGTVTTGIVSALNRPVQAGGSGEEASFINAIQTDAAINPGNSGGPLINTAGEVVGINTAIAQAGGRQTGSIGLGFSIPSNQVRRTAEQIIETGRATYPVIGVALDTRYQGEGVQVLQDNAGTTPAVTPGGPGANAGIEPGDVITHFDGVPVTSPSELIVAVRSRAPGDTVVLTVQADGGREREVEVVLDEAESE